MSRARTEQKGPGYWETGGWPVLVGTMMAAGLLAALLTVPFTVLLVAWLLCALTAVAAVFSVLPEDARITPRFVARIAVLPSLGFLAVVGLVAQVGVVGLVAALVVALTWPGLSVRLLHLPGRAARQTPARGRLRLDQALVDRRFAEIVREVER